MINEDALEQAFWDFDAARTATGAERDAFKHKVRGLLRVHMQSLEALLERTNLYLTAYTTQHDPPGGQQQARALKREVLETLAHREAL